MEEEEINIGNVAKTSTDESSSLRIGSKYLNPHSMNPATKHFSALQMADPTLLFTRIHDLSPKDYPEVLESLEAAKQSNDSPETLPEVQEVIKEGDFVELENTGSLSEEGDFVELENTGSLSEEGDVVELENTSSLPEEELKLVVDPPKPQKKKKKKKKKRSIKKLKASSLELEPVSQYVQWLNKLDKPKASLGKSSMKKKTVKELEKNEKKSKFVEESKLVAEPKGLDTVKVELSPETAKSGYPIKPKKLKEKGIQLSADVISETLAEVLAGQGHTHAALEMYEKLSLIYPEKKTLFAVKIEKLKKA